MLARGPGSSSRGCLDVAIRRPKLVALDLGVNKSDWSQGSNSNRTVKARHRPDLPARGCLRSHQYLETGHSGEGVRTM